MKARTQRPQYNKIPHITISDCLHIVADRHFLTKKMMTGNGRQVSLSHPRQMAMTLAREFTNASCMMISRSFRKNHTTALHAFELTRIRVSMFPECAAEFRFYQDQLYSLSRARIAAGAPAIIQLIQPAGGIDQHRDTFMAAAE